MLPSVCFFPKQRLRYRVFYIVSKGRVSGHLTTCGGVGNDPRPDPCIGPLECGIGPCGAIDMAPQRVGQSNYGHEGQFQEAMGLEYQTRPHCLPVPVQGQTAPPEDAIIDR